MNSAYSDNLCNELKYLKFSPKMVELLMKNSCETNWPAGFKAAQLRRQNEEIIKKLKSEFYN